MYCFEKKYKFRFKINLEQIRQQKIMNTKTNINININNCFISCPKFISYPDKFLGKLVQASNKT